MAFEENTRPLTTAAGAPVTDNQNSMSAGPRGPLLLQDLWLIEKLAHFAREVIPERRMHAKSSGAFGTLRVTRDITRYTKAEIFSQVRGADDNRHNNRGQTPLAGAVSRTRPRS